MSDSKIISRVDCGSNKWGMAITENGSVIIDFARHPNYGQIELYDLTNDDCINLAKLFMDQIKK